MEISGTKRWAMALALSAVAVHWSGAHATEPLPLKVSVKLGNYANAKSKLNNARMADQSLLGKVNLFRGVLVDEGTTVPDSISPVKVELSSINEKAQSSISAVYGGLQLSLKQNLSLVYTPGRLSSTTLNSESQGLYLLSNRGGPANWFLGVESSSYSNTSDSRRVSNTAQFGVIMSLN